MAEIKPKEMTKVDRMTVPSEVLDILMELKDTPYWQALKIVMQTYVDNRMVVAYNLDEKNPHFPILHAKESAQSLAFKFLIRFVEKEVKRLSQNG